MQGRPYKNSNFERLWEAVYGWDKCHLPVYNIFGFDAPPEDCFECKGIGTKRSTIIGSHYQGLRCIKCGAGFVRPIENGVIINQREILI